MRASSATEPVYCLTTHTPQLVSVWHRGAPALAYVIAAFALHVMQGLLNIWESLHAHTFKVVLDISTPQQYCPVLATVRRSHSHTSMQQR